MRDWTLMGSSDWLERYLEGRRAGVWHELRQAGTSVRSDDLAPEAQAVCDEMALRARYNVETIVARLEDAGYSFHSNDDERTPRGPHLRPTAGAAAVAGWLESTFELVPMTLLAWLRIVGDVWLVGTHPRWETSSEADPLVIEAEGSFSPGFSIQDHYAGDYEGWQEGVAGPAGEVPFILSVAPDRLHKANVSGGAPYGFVIPDGCADGLFVAETTMPFVEYLNWVFRSGGFPCSTGDGGQWSIRRELAADLLPL